MSDPYRDIAIAINACTADCRRFVAAVTMSRIVWQFHIHSRRMIRTLDSIGTTPH